MEHGREVVAQRELGAERAVALVTDGPASGVVRLGCLGGLDKLREDSWW